MKILTILRKKPVLRLMALFCLDGLFFGLTNAAQAPSYLLMLGFLLCSLTLYYLVYGLLSLSSLYGLSIRHRRLTLYLTGVTSLLIALQSMGELGMRDMLVLLPLACLGYMYSAYARSLRRILHE